ncbi:hypothetical protein IFM89_022444 [Coptis chinensis]|uniref:Dynamin-related protein 3A-like n=1 Tax=Coptis chinensis TaxID=261450 RepID=A0A835LWU2_9MAGN|nr:hypothetical protein IFM89_022444 [Coptis chinensis]
MAIENSLPTNHSPHSPPTSSTSAAAIGQSVIPIVNKLQDIFAQLGSASTVELPQVAVVGSQSSGKSSVLEALVGRDFLPRGSGICTRLPLFLQLLQTKTKQDGSDEEYGEFLHLPGQKFYDFSEIRREIEAETERQAGQNKGVSHTEIHLKIYSPNVLDITLVDLPGITKVPVGDQPSDIEAQIRTMILSYIKRPSCLILAVTPANSDLANSDALQIAGAADPDGNRTIGVLTKLDIMDRGADASKILLGKVIPLRLGYVGVVNRSQQDINNNRSIKDALAYEEDFFCKHHVYNALADRCGVAQLSKKLNQILVRHIKKALPGLRSQISSALVSVAKELASYGQIAESKEVDPCDGLTDDDIRTAIQNATGPRSALFVPEVPFEVLVRRQITRLLAPSLQCAWFIFEELIKMSRRCFAKDLHRFPGLRKRMDEVIGNFVRERLEPAEIMINHIIEMEADYINTSHPNFIGGSKAVEFATQQIKSSRASIPMSRPKDGGESDKMAASEKSLKSRSILARSPANGYVADQGAHPVADIERTGASGYATGSSWSLSANGVSKGISAIFGGGDSHSAAQDNTASRRQSEPVHSMELALSTIQLKEPPAFLRPSETLSEQETVEITITKLLLRSYYDIVRKNIEDSVPKAIMHFLVNHTKRELHNEFIEKLYSDNLFEEMLQEPDEVVLKRKRTDDYLCVLHQAFRTLDELPLDAETIERGYSLGTDPTGLPKIYGLQSSTLH